MHAPIIRAFDTSDAINDPFLTCETCGDAVTAWDARQIEDATLGMNEVTCQSCLEQFLDWRARTPLLQTIAIH